MKNCFELLTIPQFFYRLFENLIFIQLLLLLSVVEEVERGEAAFIIPHFPVYMKHSGRVLIICKNN
jgi:hypothetical protein